MRKIGPMEGESKKKPTLPSTCRADRPIARLSASPEGPQPKMRNTPSLQKVLRQVASYEEEMKSLARALEGGWVRGWL